MLGNEYYCYYCEQGLSIGELVKCDICGGLRCEYCSNYLWHYQELRKTIPLDTLEGIVYQELLSSLKKEVECPLICPVCFEDAGLVVLRGRPMEDAPLLINAKLFPVKAVVRRMRGE
jgi:hypothetical protein